MRSKNLAKLVGEIALVTLPIWGIVGVATSRTFYERSITGEKKNRILSK